MKDFNKLMKNQKIIKNFYQNQVIILNNLNNNIIMLYNSNSSSYYSNNNNFNNNNNSIHILLNTHKMIISSSNINISNHININKIMVLWILKLFPKQIQEIILIKIKPPPPINYQVAHNKKLEWSLKNELDIKISYIIIFK